MVLDFPLESAKRVLTSLRDLAPHWSLEQLSVAANRTRYPDDAEKGCTHDEDRGLCARPKYIFGEVCFIVGPSIRGPKALENLDQRNTKHQAFHGELLHVGSLSQQKGS